MIIVVDKLVIDCINLIVMGFDGMGLVIGYMILGVE